MGGHHASPENQPSTLPTSRQAGVEAAVDLRARKEKNVATFRVAIGEKVLAPERELEALRDASRESHVETEVARHDVRRATGGIAVVPADVPLDVVGDVHVPAHRH